MVPRPRRRYYPNPSVSGGEGCPPPDKMPWLCLPGPNERGAHGRQLVHGADYFPMAPATPRQPFIPPSLGTWEWV